MLYSRSTEHAIRALIRLARLPQGEYAMAKEIAAIEDIPAHALSKILQQLARKGWLRSCKGPSGGFMLRVPASRISLWDITQELDAISRLEPAVWPWSDDSPCALQEGWVELKGMIDQFLRGNTVGDLVVALEAKEAQLQRVSKQQAAPPEV